MAEPRAPIRAVLASFLFTDLVGFSKGTVAEQYAAKSALSAALRDNLGVLPEGDYRVKDTGDGALIIFLSSPEHALYMALAIARDFERAAASAQFPSNTLRTGMNVGIVKEAIDLESRPNFIGDGINDAKRIMDFADPGQIAASRSFYEAIAPLDAAYAAMFSHAGAPGDKHGRPHELYVVHPTPLALERLERDLGVAPSPPEAVVAATKAQSRDRVELALPDEGAAKLPVGRGRPLRRWLGAGTAATVALVVAGIYAGYIAPGVRGNAASTASPSMASRPDATQSAAIVSTPDRAPPQLGSPSAGEPDKATEVPSGDKGDAAPQESPAQPKREGSNAKETVERMTGRRLAGSASSPNVAAPAPAAILPNDAAKSRSSTRAEDSPAANATPDARANPRCSRIIEKSALGEPLTDAEKRELASSCH